MTNHVNFEADIHFPEEPGVVQVEMFGVSMNSHGTMFYGMQVEAVLDRIKDNISLDAKINLKVNQKNAKYHHLHSAIRPSRLVQTNRCDYGHSR